METKTKATEMDKTMVMKMADLVTDLTMVMETSVKEMEATTVITMELGQITQTRKYMKASSTPSTSSTSNSEHDLFVFY